MNETRCPICGSDDYSLLKRTEKGVLAVCCESGRYFEIPVKEDK